MQILCQMQAIYAMFMQGKCSLETQYAKTMKKMCKKYIVEYTTQKNKRYKLCLPCKKYAEYAKNMQKICKNKDLIFKICKNMPKICKTYAAYDITLCRVYILHGLLLMSGQSGETVAARPGQSQRPQRNTTGPGSGRGE